MRGERGCFHGILIGWFWAVRWGLSWQSQTLVVDGRGGGSHGSPNPLLWVGCDSGVLMAVSDAGSGMGRGGGSYGSPRCWLWVGRGGALKALPDAGCGAEAGFLTAVSEAGCCREMWGFSLQSQTLAVEGERHDGFSCQFPDAICGSGEAGVLMAVPYVGSGGWRWGFTWQS